jgi:hypothetical protein
MATLSDYAGRREQPLSLIAEAAVASFLSPDDAERREAVVAKRLDQIDRRLNRMERDIGISVETMAVFIRFWLNDAGATRAAAQAARHGREALRGVHRGLGRRLARDRNFGKRSLKMSASRRPARQRAIHRLQRAWINSIARPPFSCICTPRYYDDRYLLNRPNSRLF